MYIDEMAKHILTFSHIKDDNYPPPKDKLTWKIEDKRSNKYICTGRRFIFKN